MCASCGLPIFGDWHTVVQDRRGSHHFFCFYDTRCVAVHELRPRRLRLTI
jgi:hypothetical protein